MIYILSLTFEWQKYSSDVVFLIFFWYFPSLCHLRVVGQMLLFKQLAEDGTQCSWNHKARWEMMTVSGNKQSDFNLILRSHLLMQMFLIPNTKSNSCCKYRPQNIDAIITDWISCGCPISWMQMQCVAKWVGGENLKTCSKVSENHYYIWNDVLNPVASSCHTNQG